MNFKSSLVKLKSKFRFLKKRRFLMVFVPVMLVAIAAASAFLVYKYIDGRRTVSDDLLRNPVEGSLIIDEGLKGNDNVDAYAEKTGSTFAKSGEAIPGRFVLTFSENVTKEQITAYVAQFEGQLGEQIPGTNTWMVIAPESVQKDQLPQSDLVASAEEDITLTAYATPNDPGYPAQWALPRLNAPQAWDYMDTRNNAPIVAVLDTGACFDHPDMVGKFLAGYNMIATTQPPTDDHGHGCAVSGVIAANINNGIGMAGTAPKVKILPIKVLGATGSGSAFNIALGILKAQELGASVINLSLGSAVPSSFMQAAINVVVEDGVIVVAAAGNSNTTAPHYPAAFPNVISVASYDSNGQRSWFSNYGTTIDQWAPGGSIYTLTKEGGYAFKSGTSFAAPYVAGVIAVEATLCQPPLSNSANLVTKIGPVVNRIPTSSWNVCPENRMPVITSTAPTTSIYVGDTFTYDVEARDSDEDILTYSLTVAPAGATIDATTGVITWANATLGDGYGFLVSASDGAGRPGTQEFTVNVINRPVTTTSRPPELPRPLAYPFFQNAEAEAIEWLGLNPTYGCAANIVDTYSTARGEGFAVYYCTDLDANTSLGHQVKISEIDGYVPGGEIMYVKYPKHSGPGSNYGQRTITDRGWIYGFQSVVDGVRAAGWP